MTTLLVTATLGLACVIARVLYVARQARREEIEGARLARRLAWYNYRTNEWRPDSWHPDRTGDNKP